MICPVQRRLLELVSKIINRQPLSKSEVGELKESYQYLNNKMQKQIDLESLSLIAHNVEDYDWEMEICARLEALQ
jgi:hypothetical protein